MDQPGPTHLTRRTLLGASAAAAGFVAASSSSVAAAPGGASAATQWLPKDLVRRFAAPGTPTAAGFRWWWPHGARRPVGDRPRGRPGRRRRLRRARDRRRDAQPLRPRHHHRRGEARLGHGAWVAGVKAALDRAARHDIRVDITIGPSWPAAVPTITPDDDAACSELAHGLAVSPAGRRTTVPSPLPCSHAEGAVTKQTLVVAVQAFRYTRRATPGAADARPRRLRRPAPTRSSTAGITWTAPGTGRRVVGAARPLAARLGPGARGRRRTPTRGRTSSTTSAPPARRPSSTSGRPGSSTPPCAACSRKAGGYLFEDSLEIETDATIWTPRMLEEFERRAGYDLLPYLPVVLEVKEKYVFAYDAVTTTRVRDDFNQVLSDLYRDHHLLPVQGFARSLGMGLRVQPYGLETDTVEHAALLDVPETESLGFKNLDDYRVMAGGRDMAGHTVLSCEAICYAGAAYQTTWRQRAARAAEPALHPQQHLRRGREHGDDPRVRVRRRARRHLAGLRRVLAVLQRRRRVRRRLGPRTPQWRHIRDVVRLPRPHPARAADRHAALRHRLPASEGLGLHRHRRLRGRPTTASRSAGPTRSPRRRCSTCRCAKVRAWPARPGRPGVQGDDHRPRPVPRRGAHDGRRRRPHGCWSSAGPGCRSSSSATGPTAEPVGPAAQPGETDRAAVAGRADPRARHDPDGRRRHRDPGGARRPRDHARRRATTARR